MKKFLPTLFVIANLNASALNINIIQANSNGNTPAYFQWEDVALAMGHNAVIHPKTFLDNMANLTATDILILSIATDISVYNSARITNIVQYLQQGGKVFLQSEFNETYAGNVAFQSIVNALGSQFAWKTQPVTGFLTPMQVAGAMATDSTVASFITQSFWWGDPAACDDDMEHFLEFNGEYFGFIYCVPGTQGRIITMSDQDIIQNYFTSEVDSLMRNIITNLSKTSYTCNLDSVMCDPLSTLAAMQDEAGELSIYPNPVFNYVNLLYSNINTPGKVEIYNSMGEMVISLPLQQEINVSALPESIYFLKLYREGRWVSRKFIKYN